MTDIDEKTTLLTPAEVVSLQHQIEAGLLARAARETGTGRADATDDELRLLEDQGEWARQRFIGANLGLVWMVARQFAARGRLPETDLFQEGCLGLLTAVVRFDHTRGVRFSTYALFWIRAYVGGAAARQLGAMNLPTSRAEQLRAARGVEIALAQQLGRAPTVVEVADALGRDPGWTAGLLAHQAPASLDELDVADRDRLTTAGEARLVRAEQEVVREMLWRLDDLGRRVLELRMGFGGGGPLSYADVARTLGVSVNRVRRTEARALERLRGICPQQAAAYLSA
jgi:RNA polymerase primary sigma factor